MFRGFFGFGWLGWDLIQRQGDFVLLAKELLRVLELLAVRFGFNGVLIAFFLYCFHESL